MHNWMIDLRRIGFGRIEVAVVTPVADEEERIAPTNVALAFVPDVYRIKSRYHHVQMQQGLFVTVRSVDPDRYQLRHKGFSADVLVVIDEVLGTDVGRPSLTRYRNPLVINRANAVDLLGEGVNLQRNVLASHPQERLATMQRRTIIETDEITLAAVTHEHGIDGVPTHTLVEGDA